MSITDLPLINAILNGASAILLASGWYHIRRGGRRAVTGDEPTADADAVRRHRTCMLAALFTSAVFLTCYLIYHFSVTTVTRFQDPAWFRPWYLGLLISHTIMAVVTLPFIIMTFMTALKGRIWRHRRLVRFTLPAWMYVSITGVLIYLLLYQVFPQGS